MKTPNTNLSLLTHPDVVRAIRGVLVSKRWRRQDLEDGIQDVHMKALAAFERGAPVPEDVGAMRALCVKIAENHAIDALRAAGRRTRDFVGPCDPDEYGPLHYGEEERDPADLRRQFDVLVSLFREGAMPEEGFEILEGVASGSTLLEIADELGLTRQIVRWRLDKMRTVFRRRMLELGRWPTKDFLHLVASAAPALALVHARRRAA
jgi:DNA-directed RNA polymerase specialized sigma24 family protein